MSLEIIIKESIDGNVVALQEAVVNELRARIKLRIEETDDAKCDCDGECVCGEEDENKIIRDDD